MIYKDLIISYLGLSHIYSTIYVETAQFIYFLFPVNGHHFVHVFIFSMCIFNILLSLVSELTTCSETFVTLLWALIYTKICMGFMSCVYQLG